MKPAARLILLGTAALALFLVILTTRRQVEAGDSVLVHYLIALDDGTVYFSTEDREPIWETVGEGRLIPGFEEALLGMQAGETKVVEIPPEKAYGEYHSELVEDVPRERLAEDSQPLIGRSVWVEFDDGRPALAYITALTEETVTLDANHPLAGLNLTLTIELQAIEPAQMASFHLVNNSLTWLLGGLGGILLGALIFLIKKRVPLGR